MTRLVELGADINAVSEYDGATPLMWACYHQRNEEAALLLLDLGADGVGPRETRGYSTLHYASESGSLHVIRRLVELGADINAVGGERGMTPLMWTCFIKGKEEAALHLLDLGADGVGLRDSRGLSPLHFASQNGFLRVIRRLVEAGADIAAFGGGDGTTPLMAACHTNGKEETALLLLDLGADGVGQKDNEKLTTLHHASEGGLLRVIRRLVEAGADLNVTGGYERISPLMAACEGRKEDAALLLLDLGADGVGPRDKRGFSTLHVASQKGLLLVSRRLVGLGADINAAGGCYGHTPLMAACQNVWLVPS
jgi:serine/threonine-protein phosphatase 6 regulatory ankyrin repeat subunit B